MRKISIHKRERLIIILYCFASTLLSIFFLILAQGRIAPPAVADPFSNTAKQIWVDVAGKVKNPGIYSLGLDARINDALNAAGGILPGVDLTSLNLAQHVVDSEEIIIGTKSTSTPFSLVIPQPLGESSGEKTQSQLSTSSPNAAPKASAAPTSANNSTGGRVKVNNSVAVSKTVAPVAIAKPSSSSRGKKGVPTSAININVATLDQLEQLPGVGPIMAQKIIDFRVKYGKFKKITDVQNVAGMGAAHYAKISKYIKVS